MPVVPITHLRVFERQGPMMFTRCACHRGERKGAQRLTDDAGLVTCNSCRRTKWWKQASQDKSEGGGRG